MFSDPEQNIAQIALSEGDHVADLGAGSGHYSMAAAKVVGGAGKVFVIDIKKDLLDVVRMNAEKSGIKNIEIIWGDIEEVNGTRLRDQSVDAVIVSNVLFQVKDKAGLVTETKRILKPGGKVLVVDWSESFNNLGPHTSQVFSEDEAKNLFTQAGFSIHKEITAGDHHYGFMVTV